MNPPEDVLRGIIARARTIAIVGLSDKPTRDSNEAGRYLQGQGYRIVPVNPLVTEVLGERSYPSVAAIPAGVPVDVVDIYRRPEEVPAIMDDSIGRKVPVVWMQLGISNPEAADRGRAAGLTVVEDLCLMSQHRRMGIGPVGNRT
ncbi:MAG: CoA-binding protein [Thermoplasmata archaeon]|jgi:predicted CoA-binding protein